MFVVLNTVFQNNTTCYKYFTIEIHGKLVIVFLNIDHSSCSLSPSPHTFKDICFLTNGDPPAWLSSSVDLELPLGLELLEAVLTAYPKVFVKVLWCYLLLIRLKPFIQQYYARSTKCLRGKFLWICLYLIFYGIIFLFFSNTFLYGVAMSNL